MDGTEETKLLGDGEGDEPASSAPEKEAPSLVVGCAKVNEEVTDSCLCGLKALSSAHAHVPRKRRQTDEDLQILSPSDGMRSSEVC